MNAHTPVLPAIDVRPAGEGDAAAWDAYVNAAPGAGFFHLWGWGEVVRRAYGYESLRLVARRGARIVGVLPLVDVRSRLFGRSLISSAFTTGGGAVADDAQALAVLAGAAVEIGRARRVRYVELRSEKASLEGWETKHGVYASFRKEMPADEAEHFAALPRGRRRILKKAIIAADAGEMNVRFDGDPEIFYRLYAQTLRDHGTPIFSKWFLREILRAFSEHTEISVAEYRGEPVAALLSFYFRDSVMPYYFGAAPHARDLQASFYLYWMQMRCAADKGVRIFDFGRSRYGAGSFDHKVYWGFEPSPLEYQYALIEAGETPNVNPDSPKFNFAARAWRQLPLPLANRLGPAIARHLA